MLPSICGNLRQVLENFLAFHDFLGGSYSDGGYFVSPSECSSADRSVLFGCVRLASRISWNWSSKYKSGNRKALVPCCPGKIPLFERTARSSVCDPTQFPRVRFIKLDLQRCHLEEWFLVWITPSPLQGVGAQLAQAKVCSAHRPTCSCKGLRQVAAGAALTAGAAGSAWGSPAVHANLLPTPSCTMAFSAGGLREQPEGSWLWITGWDPVCGGGPYCAAGLCETRDCCGAQAWPRPPTGSQDHYG